MVDLCTARADLYERGDATITATAEYVAQQGLNWSTIEAHAGCLVLTGAAFLPHGRFEFCNSAPICAAIVEALDEDAETVVDLVGWPLNQPMHVASMFGRAAVVGASALLNPATYAFERPLQVRRSPLEWLQAGSDGIAVVTPHRAARLLLQAQGLGRIAGQDIAHARQIYALAGSILDPGRFVAPKLRAT
jgi:hypothetical protein